MMVIGRLIRSYQAVDKICSANSMYSSFRRFSVLPSAGPPELCFVMGQYGKVIFPGNRWQSISDYLDEQPLLDDVPNDRLFGIPNPLQPYMTNDSGCRFLETGLYLPFFSSILRRSYSGAFQMENLGVIRDIGMLAFRTLEEDAERKWIHDCWAGYDEYSSFMKILLHQRYPSSYNLLPKGLAHFFSCIDQHPRHNILLDHPALLSDEKFGNMMIKVSMLLRHQFPIFGKRKIASNILYQIGYHMQGGIDTCQKHPYLTLLLPDSLKNPQFTIDTSSCSVIGGPKVMSCDDNGWSSIVYASPAIKLGTGGPGVPIPLPTIPAHHFLSKGLVMVDVNRHGCVHSVESHQLPLMNFLPGLSANSLMKNPFTRREVIRLLRYSLAGYLPWTYISFVESGQWDELGARELDPIPSICFAPGY